MTSHGARTASGGGEHVLVGAGVDVPGRVTSVVATAVERAVRPLHAEAAIEVEPDHTRQAFVGDDLVDKIAQPSRSPPVPLDLARTLGFTT